MLEMLQDNCNKNTMESQVSIANQLKKLNEWQEEQKRLLDERQNMQRKMLGLEHQNMYEKLGFFHASDIIENEDDGSGDKPFDQGKRHGNVCDSEIIEMEKIMFEGSKEVQVKFSNQPTYSKCENDDLEVKAIKPKRPFLKRGEGIKQRYKISPESLRLNNLPRYKYATNNPKIKNLQRRRLVPKANPSKEIPKENPKKVEAIDESEKFDGNEKQFQQMLAKSKPGYSSTPDCKTTKHCVSSISITLPNVRLGEEANKEAKSKKHYKNNVNNQQVEPFAAITWSKVLDPQIVRPIPIKEIRAGTATKNVDNFNTKNGKLDDEENLSIFELLERQAAEGTIDMNSSCMRNFMEHKKDTEENQDNESDIPVDKIYAECGLRPAVQEVLRTDSDDDGNLSDTIDEHYNNSQTPHVSTYLSDETKHNSTLNTDKLDLRVRFSEENTTCEYDSRNDIISDSSVLLDEETASNKSSDLFHQFKDALFSALLGKNESECNAIEQNMVIQSPPSALTQELQEKSNVIKMRLEELEKEIAAFRSNNVELMRAKQEYEIERTHFSQERNEALDRLKDDKIQMEMYLHDERMKIEEDKRKFEQQMRIQKQAFTNKERKEVARLKDELESLQMQLKQKDQLHASAQARLRVQIKNLERDQKQLYEEIERLTKENKRLQNEKQKIERDGNNKMLMEINRNIAKLAPKLNYINSHNTSPEHGDFNNRFRSKHTNTSSHSPAVLHKANANKVQRVMKAPPNTRNTSRTNLSHDIENATILYNPEIPNKHNNSDIDIADEGDTDVDDDDEDDDIIAELRMTQNKISLKSIQSSSRSNTSKETVVLKCDKDGKDEDNENPTKKSLDSTIIDYSAKSAATTKSLKSTTTHAKSNTSEAADNCRREIINSDGSRDIWYPNGNLKKISADGMNIRMLYFNKDIKETNVNEGTVKYYYAETNIWHTTYLDGLEILEFPNGQTEHRYKNGIVEIHLPDNSVKITNPAERDKLEEWRFADGTTLVQMRNGDRILMLPNGQKEIHTKLNKRREYPDGTVKIVYPDGSQETRYSNGRVRLKDKDGNLVLDTERN
ncbi:inner centromere protein A [Eurosta solidaginis]|uniref:inner centromere protein A n=1 Tax=Eurosta solidaginis TaxID=178769 RepID=UPI0035308D99